MPSWRIRRAGLEPPASRGLRPSPGSPMRSPWLLAGALSGGLTVALGAFGAHALKDRLDPAQLEIWHTGVQYQGLHALALGWAGLEARRTRRGRWAGLAFLAGTFLFCGSLYGIALGAPKSLGAITPVGGLSFLMGWAMLAWAARAGETPARDAS